MELYNYFGSIVYNVEKALPKPPASPCYGLYRYGNGPVQVHAEESKVIRLIFQQYLSGSTAGKIAASLFEQNIPSPFGKPKWARNSLDNLLSNPLYIDTIVPADVFEKVQAEKARRSATIKTEYGIIKKATRYSTKHVLSGLLVCADCGSPYWRITRKGQDTSWLCSHKSKKGAAACPDSPYIKESVLMEQLAGYFTSDGRLNTGIKQIRVHAGGALEVVLEPEMAMSL